ncbi:polyketide cyclase/dehydrase/lipid transport protein [Kribbella sp. VKM Ac-2527]|uniref:Polyketide cyclase/dehydrase/lipid transport protein n=1 Tax=Kribbella caucasensis TaxID=2512215 RepID=A0A4R6KL27_9ACTN|nr:SRPBCC family protein [Kribbella sp. VKM Ac-2527]TDO51476.1 polyketide cyclase/dehydrase/lipid transport protein [Kribbella sp. VKM Ac-2527]
MRFESSVTVQASPERVWEVFSDVAKWPEWTPTIESVERLDEGPIHLGARTRIRQPKLPVAIWEVTELKDGEYFEWVSRAPGIKTTGGHRVEATPDGTVATSIIIQEGPLGWLFGKLYANLTRRYIKQEGESLKQATENQ